MTPLLQVLVAGLLLGLVYAIIGGGLSLAFAVLRVLNLAHGGLVVIGAFTSWILWTDVGLHPILTIPLSALFLFFIGVLLQATLVEPVLRYGIITSLTLLFGVSLVIQGLGLYFFGVTDRVIRHFEGSIAVFGTLNVSIGRLVVGALAIPVLLGVHLYLNYTRLGVATKATAQNAQISQACGINIRRIRILTMGYAAAMAGVAGSLLVNLFPISPQSGLEFGVTALIVAIVGGLGSFYGAIGAGIFIGAVNGVVSLYWSSQATPIALFLLLAFVLVIRPSGLAGVRDASY